ncbi:MAG TPA: hypothetical protein VNW29_04120 [Candidatus Sulfotelmatobacter sp.]|jgi:hypothetical protein|nr:hypothetical protein [Candidatus Sulfotelmatobacter sp.]
MSKKQTIPFETKLKIMKSLEKIELLMKQVRKELEKVYLKEHKGK